MITSPSIDQILEGVVMALEDDIMPNVDNPKAQASCQMIQSLLLGVRQLLVGFDAQLVDEHNQMIDVLVAASAALDGVDGVAADRMRERGAMARSCEHLPSPMDRTVALEAHRKLSEAIEQSFYDLDELLAGGSNAAMSALDVIREHLGQRYVRDVVSFTVGDGFVGRS